MSATPVTEAPQKTAETRNSVQATVFDLLRHYGLTTVFGNPGSTEIGFLQDFPDDFTYILGLQEAVVVGMADGYSQIARAPAFVNLHTAAGVGNAMGAILNAAANRTPLIVTAGQQVRPMLTLEPLLANPDATVLPRPAVKWAYETPRPQDAPAALARAIAIATTPPCGPVFVSLPHDDFTADLTADEQHAARTTYERHLSPLPQLSTRDIEHISLTLAQSENPVMVVGSEIDTARATEQAATLAERLGCPVWSAPGERGVNFPQTHPQFQGFLDPGIRMVSDTLTGHDVICVLGAPVFRYYPYVPGQYLPDNATLIQITSDPSEAQRAPVGDAFIGNVGHAVTCLSESLPPTARTTPPRHDPMSAAEAAPLILRTLADAAPENAVWVQEAPSVTLPFQDQVRLDPPSEYLTSTSGGLGFGLAAAVGASLADRERPVIAVMGDGSTQYAVTALWSAAHYQTPVTFVVLKNQEYAILKWFSEFEHMNGVPGLEIPGLDTATIATGYGVHSQYIEDAATLREVFTRAVRQQQTPTLIEVPLSLTQKTAVQEGQRA